MKSTSENQAIYTTYTTHAICVLGEDEVEDEGAEEGVLIELYELRRLRLRL
jgi:hypothetical protein